MKKILFAFLAAAMLFSLAACNSEVKQTQTTAATTTTVAEEEPSNTPKTVSLRIAGSDVSEYTIVYARAEYFREGAESFTTEWDFYKLIAKEIADKIFALTGVSLPVIQDTRAQESAKEILVGPTNRGLSGVYDEMDVYSYQNTVKDGKLVLGGGYNSSSLNDELKTSYSWGATYHAFDSIEEHVKAKMNEGISEVDLAEGFEQKGEVELITVACVGDSITEGDGCTDWNYCSYPSVLQRVLWKDYVIVNYGKCGKTMRNDLSRSYTSTDAYRAAQKQKDLFDAVVIMLGTNDGGVDKEEFTADEDKLFNDCAMNLVSALTPADKDVKIAILNCTAYYGKNPGTRDHVRDLQEALVPKLIEKGYDTTFVDTEKYTADNLGKSHFPDGIHPDDSGYAMLGEYISGVVVQMFQ